MCWDLNYATYTGKSNLENIIFMYNSSSSCLFVTHIIHWLRAWLNNWIMCMLHIITPCSYCQFKEAKLGTVKLSVLIWIYENTDGSWMHSELIFAERSPRESLGKTLCSHLFSGPLLLSCNEPCLQMFVLWKPKS